MVKALLQDDEEPEDEGTEGSIQRARYLAQKARKEDKEKTYNFLENMITSTISETTLITDPESITESFLSKNSIESSVGRIAKVATALVDYSLGDGSYESLDKAVKKTFIPSAFRGIVNSDMTLNEDWRAGFETRMDKEFKKDEVLDEIFATDYKKDMAEYKKAREEAKKIISKNLIKAGIKEGSADYKSVLNKALNAKFKKPDRNLYDENQQKREIKD